ncbi:ribosome maturation factor RimP [Marinicellulosiphila megalodicopiae]
MAKEQELIDLIQPIVEGLGFVYWGLEYVGQGKYTTLSVYIDSPNGIDVENCAEVSRQISAMMDVEDPITAEYTLEVSSPGVDRLLFTVDQYEQYIGEKVQVKLRAPFDGRRNFKGQLKGVEDGDAVVQVDQEEFLLPIDLIDRAQIIPTFK